MIRREAQFAILFRHWLKANPQISCSYELKDTRDKYFFRFAELKEEQKNYALAINSNKGVLIRVQGGGGEPDYIYLRNSPAYIVIKYPSSFSVIPIQTLLLEESRLVKGKRLKSLTEKRAEEISIITVQI